jgi:hypothetical protein
MEKFGSGIRVGKKSNPGSRINIPDPQHFRNLISERIFYGCVVLEAESKSHKQFAG